MKPTDFVLCLIDACGGTVSGRTLLQKMAFFVAELLGEDFGLKFDAHYYGPFSSTVEGTLIQLKNLGFVQESSTGFGILSDGFEVRRYDYSLTDDGRQLLEGLRSSALYSRIQDSVRRIRAAGNPNYIELSIAAKAYFILKRKEGGMSISEIQKEAEKYSWNISPRSIERAVAFLQSVKLATA